MKYLAFMFLLLCGCNHRAKEVSSNKDSKIDSSVVVRVDSTFKAITRKTGFALNYDSTINSKLHLRNTNSIIDAFGDISNNVIENQSEAPYTYVLNSKGNEYLKMLIWYGDPKNMYSYFIVGYSTDSIKKQSKISLKVAKFETENDVKLGMLMGTLIGMKGNTELRNKENDLEVLTYLKPDNELYESKYYFKNDSLVKYSFGFVYP